MSSSDPVRWGVLSTAAINDLVLDGARASDAVDVVTVASRDLGRAERYARDKGIDRAHGSYEALLEDPDVEAVYISLPNALHVPWTVRALEAGKHVLCEKPLARDPERVAEAFDAADGAGRLLMEAFMWRHNPQTARLRELLEAGAVGRPALVRACFSFAMADPATDVRNQADLDGGALMDVGCYCVSGARLVAREPERVQGHAVVGPGGVDVRFAGVMAMPDEVTAVFDCGILGAGERDELEVVGDEGSLFLDDPWHCRAPVIEHRRGETTERIELERADSYRLELENLGAAIRGRGAPLLGRDDALGQARTIEALYRSAEEGRAVAPG